MPTTNKNQRIIRVALEEGSETQVTLLEWAGKRGLTLGKAAKCILVDWSDAVNGKPNPFAIAIAAVSGGFTSPAPVALVPTTPTPEPEMSPEEKLRREASLQAVDQFMD